MSTDSGQRCCLTEQCDVKCHVAVDWQLFQHCFTMTLIESPLNMLSFNLRIKRALVHADWQSSQHHSNAPSPPDHHLQRKRCRMEHRLHEGIPVPFSQLISSARDPSAPTVNIVVRSLTATAATQQSVDSTAGEQEDYGSDGLSRTLASQSRQGSGPFQSCSRSWAEVEAGPAAVAAAARQAVAVLEQQWQQLEQPTMPDMRRAKRRQRYNTLYPQQSLCIAVHAAYTM